MKESILTQYSSAGGEKLIACKGKSQVELLIHAVEASKSGAKVVMNNLEDLDRSSLERIAIAGKGHVLFDHR